MGQSSAQQHKGQSIVKLFSPFVSRNLQSQMSINEKDADWEGKAYLGVLGMQLDEGLAHHLDGLTCGDRLAHLIVVQQHELLRRSLLGLTDFTTHLVLIFRSDESESCGVSVGARCECECACTTSAACRNVLPAFVLLCPVLAIDGFIPEYKMRTQFLSIYFWLGWLRLE